MNNFLKKTVGFMGLLMILGGIYILQENQLSFTNPFFIVIAATSVFLILISFTGLKGNIPESTTHGSAGWATEKDIQELLVDSQKPPAPGSLILGPALESPGSFS